jgi:DNA-binding CsgD family transcriptional regulator/tetratricopeptide (TPR) repeat protein
MDRVLVGRDAECAGLRRALTVAQGRRAPVVLVSGEGGAGKTTLVEYVLARTGTSVLSGRAGEWAGAAYDVLARALRPAFRDMAGPVPPVLAQIFPERAAPPADPDPAALAAGVCSALASLAGGGSLALFLDDLQWADQATLGLLPALADAAAGLPVTLVGCYRSDELPRDHRLRAVRAQLRRSRQLAEIDLGPLGDEDVVLMLTHLLGGKPEPALAAAVASRADGIPFAVEELALALRDGAPGASAGAAVVPDGIREAVLLRAARLSGEERALLEAAAVAGQEFDIDQVLAVCGLPAWPDGFTGAGLLAETRDGRAAFRHSLTREAAYADIPWSRRRRLHRDLARTLAGAGSAPALIAVHLLAARDFEAARGALIAAADAHCAVHAYRDAARALRTALEHWPASEEDDTRLAVVGRLARCAEMCSDYAEAVTLLRELADEYERRGEAGALAGAQRRLALVHELRGQWEAALTAREAAAVAFSAAGLRAEAAIDRLAVATHLRAAGSYSAALGTLVSAKADAESSGRTDLLLRAEGLRGNLLSRLGQPGEGIAAVRAALDRALEGSLSDTAADLQQRLADSLEHAGHYRAATAVYAAAYQFCETHGADAVGQLCRACATVVLFTRGEWDRTAAVCEDVLASPAVPHARGAAAGMLGLVHAMRGAPRQARPHLLESHLIATRIELVPMELFSSWGLCVLESSAGSCAEAADRARRVLTRLARTQERHFSVQILQWMAAFFAEQGMAADVRACAAALAGMAETTGQPEAIAALAHARGETLLADEPETALRELRGAAEKFAELDLPYATAQAQRRAAEAAARTGDKAAALELLHAAHDTAGRLGARLLRAACANALGDLGDKPRVPAASRGARGTRAAGGLTGRELEIMLLVAQGNTSRQIGEALFISPRTVEMHVQGSLLKLGCRTRAQAVRRLAELGTLPPGLSRRYRVGRRSFGTQQHDRGAGIERQLGPPRPRALAGQRGPDPGQRSPAARAGRYPVTRQVASCRGGPGVGHRDRRVQAVAQVGPGQPGGSAAVEPGHDGLAGRDGA